MEQIKKVSLFFRVLFQCYFIAAPIMLIYGWINAPTPLATRFGPINLANIPEEYPKHILHILTIQEKLLGFLTSAIPMAITLFITYSLIKLFKLYENGEIFSVNNVRYIRNTGYGLLISQLISPIHEALMGLVLTYQNHISSHDLVRIQISLGQNNFAILLIGLLVILISWVMIEGCQLREEQQLTV